MKKNTKIKKKVVKKTTSKKSVSKKTVSKKKPVKKVKVAAAKKKVQTVVVPDSEAKSLAKKIASIASDHKAEDIVVLSLAGLTSFTDFFMVCTGNSDRQVSAIADSIRAEIKKDGRLPLGEEGIQEGRWALLDYGEVVVHVFYKELRDYYQLERLWHDAPRLKISGVTS